jgi:hypothetical protein
MSTVLAGLVAAATPLLAHHSFSAEYDDKKPLTLTGTVNKIEWLNPHARFYVDVKEPDGQLVTWEFELGSPNQLTRRGWRRTTLKIGDAVTVNGYPAKDGAHLANARTVTMANGQRIFSGSAGDGGPEK